MQPQLYNHGVEDSAVQTFNFNGLALRALLIDGEPNFILVDACKALDLSSPHKVAASLDEDDRNSVPVTDSLGRVQQTWAVTESGLYQIIFQSRKAEAKAFKRWVTHDVLPAIRKTGSYSAGKKPETALEWAEKFVEAEKARLALVEENKELKPRAKAYDEFLGATGYVDVKQASVLLKRAGIDIGRNCLFDRLVSLGWIYRVKGGYAPNARYEKQGLVSGQARTRPDWKNPGQRVVCETNKIIISTKGLHRLRELLLPPIDVALLEGVA